MDARVAVSLLSSWSDEEARFALAIAAAELGIWDWDVPTNGMRYSMRAREICGFPQDGIVTFEMVKAVTHPEDFPRTFAMAREALDPAKRKKPVYEYRIVRADGATRWVLAQGQAVFDGPGPQARALRYVGTIQDITESKEAADALKASEASLRLALEAGRLAVWNFDVAAGALSGSPDLYRILGYPDGVAPTLDDIRAHYFPADRELVRLSAEAALAKGERFFEARFRFQPPGAPLRWLDLRAELQFGGDGRPVAVVGVIADVTKQKHAELQRSDALARLLAALEAAGAGTWKWTVAEDSVEWDEALCKVYGIAYAARPRRAGAFLELVHPDDREKTRDAIAAAVAAKGELQHEFRIRGRDGEIRWIHDRARPLLAENGEIDAFVGACTDITARKQSEQRLTASEKRLRRAHEGAGIGDFELDLATGAVAWSDSLYRLIGRRRDNFALTPENLWDLVHPDDRETVANHTARATEGEPLDFEFRVRHADGGYRWLACRGERQLDERGIPVRLVGVNFDVTEMREAQLRQQRLIHELNHRVKNTLATVQSLAHLTFKAAEPEPPELKAFLDRLMALSATHALLTASLWEKVSLEDVILAELKPYHGPRIALDGGPPILLQPNAAVSLGMGIHELATNAAKYGALSAPHGRLSISWRSPGNGRASLSWVESGLRTPPDFTKSGFGAKLIKGVIESDLNGAVRRTFDNARLEIAVDFELA